MIIHLLKTIKCQCNINLITQYQKIFEPILKSCLDSFTLEEELSAINTQD